MSPCLFCQRKVREIDYKDAVSLRAAIRDDGTLLARRGKLDKKGKRRRGSGFCRRHQTQFATAVKRARFMGLLPNERPPKVVKWPPKERKRRPDSP